MIHEVFSDTPFYAPIQAIVFLVSNALMCGLFLYHRRETRDRWIKEEAQEFLTRRSLKHASQSFPKRNKILRGLLWAPTLAVSLVFLFLPETLGIASHSFRGLSLDHRRINIPLTWIIADEADTTDDTTNAEIGSSIWVVAAKGIGRVGARMYLYGEEPISEMTFSTYPGSLSELKPPALSSVLSKLELSFGDEILICWDFTPFAGTRPEPVDSNIAEIICDSTNHDFQAYFSGSRAYSKGFYDVLFAASEKDSNNLPRTTPEKSDRQ